MTEILQEYENGLREIINRHPLSNGGTPHAMLGLIDKIKACVEECEKFGVEEGNKILENNPQVPKAELIKQLRGTWQKALQEHLPANFHWLVNQASYLR